jgi:hypothetical protein
MQDPEYAARMFADDEVSNEVVLYMRFMTASELLANQADVCYVVTWTSSSENFKRLEGVSTNESCCK